mmetsp:Transcript_29037/g.43872  ORF Transcript_29037/g.43872 Transcript_29037/m.43872 type:complete len:370 (-) Transcript_29037:415-1524(-)|eukprot:CAMPEP_0178909782 /NCGR_PEP_ID=MMETSP0786-20121207/8727_1 /TAXON_ID=186022 /ORGANISM="Thalassionema frauenfeldii, Strain CCMP 1798" /LENGTH=369 /DNA_ID=CAMNT_0020581949 /DNA_START=149 /DNA_END=1258 /DNA_ORIENTATION=-
MEDSDTTKFRRLSNDAASSVDSNYDPDTPTAMDSNSRLSMRNLSSADADSVDSNFDPEIPTAIESSSRLSMRFSLENNKYDAKRIRLEFLTYRSVLPKPDKLLQNRYSFQMLRHKIMESNATLPRFLRYNNEGGIKPHHALLCLLLSDHEEGKNAIDNGCLGWFIRTVTFGYFDRQLNHPAEYIRDQFNRIAHIIPAEVVTPAILRKKIRNNCCLPVPNYFLDPEDPNQFPPHIALLVLLQEGEEESKHMGNVFYHVFFSLFAVMALTLRIVLEVIGGAGAIWGGAEVFTLRRTDNADLWRWLSIAIGIMCYLRFITLNAPQPEDGNVLGPAGPWSLRLRVRMRAVTNNPWHYFVRATVPPAPEQCKKR